MVAIYSPSPLRLPGSPWGSAQVVEVGLPANPQSLGEGPGRDHVEGVSTSGVHLLLQAEVDHEVVAVADRLPKLLLKPPDLFRSSSEFNIRLEDEVDLPGQDLGIVEIADEETRELVLFVRGGHEPSTSGVVLLQAV